MTEKTPRPADVPAAEPARALPPAAVRAIEEARLRREKVAADSSRSTEVDGPKGPEPTRYGDWERNGITSDF